MAPPIGYHRVRSYEVHLYGPQGGALTYNDIEIKLHTDGAGVVSYQMNYQTDQALPKMRFLVDLLRNEQHVFCNPDTNVFAVLQEEVGEKDR